MGLRTPIDRERLSHRASLLERLEPRQLLAAVTWSAQDHQINLDAAVAAYPWINGSGETVAVIDQGVDYNHPALGGGYGKKVVASWNFDNGTFDVMPYDNNAHGTGTVGQIAADPHVVNGQVYQGVAPGVKIVALRATGADEIKQAFDWVIANRSAYNIVAVNYVDITGSSQASYLGELQQLRDQNVFVAGAVGNYGPGPAYAEPGQLIYTVGSVDANDNVSSFTPRPNVDFMAPGENVDVTWYSNGISYDTISSGTSWAGPQVTGTAALIKQVNPNFTDADVYSIILNSAHPVYDPVSKQSYPRLDVKAALDLALARSGAANGGGGGSASGGGSSTPTGGGSSSGGSTGSSGGTTDTTGGGLTGGTTSGGGSTGSSGSSGGSGPPTTTGGKNTGMPIWSGGSLITSPFLRTHGAAADTLAKPQPPVVAPIAGSSFTVTSTSATSLLLTWLDNSTNEVSFLIERSTKARGKYTRVALLLSTRGQSYGTGTRTYADTGLATGRTYYYRITAISATGGASAPIAATGVPAVLVTRAKRHRATA